MLQYSNIPPFKMHKKPRAMNIFSYRSFHAAKSDTKNDIFEKWRFQQSEPPKTTAQTEKHTHVHMRVCAHACMRRRTRMLLSTTTTYISIDIYNKRAFPSNRGMF